MRERVYDFKILTVLRRPIALADSGIFRNERMGWSAHSFKYSKDFGDFKDLKIQKF